MSMLDYCNEMIKANSKIADLLHEVLEAVKKGSESNKSLEDRVSKIESYLVNLSLVTNITFEEMYKKTSELKGKDKSKGSSK